MEGVFLIATNYHAVGFSTCGLARAMRGGWFFYVWPS